MYRRILLATDGSPTALRAAQSASFLATAFGAKLTVVNVQPRYNDTFAAVEMGFTLGAVSQEYFDDQSRCATEASAEICKRTRAALDVKESDVDCVSATGPAGDMIVALAAERKCDLIVIGHRGLNMLQSIFLGSTSERIVHTATCAVLVVR